MHTQLSTNAFTATAVAARIATHIVEHPESLRNFEEVTAMCANLMGALAAADSTQPLADAVESLMADDASYCTQVTRDYSAAYKDANEAACIRDAGMFLEGRTWARSLWERLTIQRWIVA